MEKQEQIQFEEEIKPEVTIVRNKYMSVNSIIQEEIIKKIWVIPLKQYRNI